MASRIKPKYPSQPTTHAQNGRAKVIHTFLSKASTILANHPLPAFGGLLCILLLLIIIGNTVSKPNNSSAETNKPAQLVKVLGIGDAPRLQIQAKVEKTGVLKISAQAGGVVTKVKKIEGASVAKGEALVTLSTNAVGGNIPSLSRQIAQKSYQQTSDTLPIQLELIAKRKEIANKSDTQSDRFREITAKSIDDTKSIISLNEELLKSIDSQISELEKINPPSPTDSAALLQAKQGKAAILSALTNLRTGLRTSEYQSGGDNEPAKLSDVSRELTLAQLELEERGALLNKEISALNVKISQVAESLMYPSSPCSGKIERFYVRFGQTISPGTPIAAIVCNATSTQIVALVSPALSTHVSTLEDSHLLIDNRTIPLRIHTISTQPTEGSLNSILFSYPEQKDLNLTEGSFVTVTVPLRNEQTTSAVPFIPLDAVYQTQEQAYVYLAVSSKDGLVAKNQTVTLGNVLGATVEIRDGLSVNDQVIVDRNVVDGQLITLKAQ